MKARSYSPSNVYLLISLIDLSPTGGRGCPGSSSDRQRAMRHKMFGVMPVLAFNIFSVTSASLENWMRRISKSYMGRLSLLPEVALSDTGTAFTGVVVEAIGV